MALSPRIINLNTTGGNPIIREEQLDKFALSIMNAKSPDQVDIVTPRHPLWRMLEEKKAKGMSGTEPIGKGPVRDFLYETEDHSTDISATSGIKDFDYTEREGETQAQYYWVIHYETVTLDEAVYITNAGALQLFDILTRDKRKAEKAFRNKQVDRLWNGVTVGRNKMWGLKDIIRFDPTTDPSRGAVGGITAVDGQAWGTKWRNQATNYNDVSVDWRSGGKFRTFVDDDTSSSTFYDLWYDCSNHEKGEMEEGQPDLIPCNKAFMKALNSIIQDRIVLQDLDKTHRLGVKGYDYRGAMIFEDPSVPDDPNTSTYGVAMLVNTNVVEWLYAAGVDSGWSPLARVPGKTAFACHRKRVYTIACSAPGWNGVFFGLKPRSYTGDT